MIERIEWIQRIERIDRLHYHILILYKIIFYKDRMVEL